MEEFLASIVCTCENRHASEKPIKKRKKPSWTAFVTKAVIKKKIIAEIRPPIMILCVPILSPNSPKRGQLKMLQYQAMQR